MPVVSVDIGNSSIKLLIDHPNAQKFANAFQAPGESNSGSLKLSKTNASVLRIDKTLELPEKFERLSEHFSFEAEPCDWSVCSVDSAQTEQLRKWVRKERGDDTFHVITADEVGLETIPNRSKIGRDRLLSGWVSYLGTGQSGPVIVADSGTAVTIDVVDGEGKFCGGLISPGTDVMLKALHNETDALPDLTKTQFDVAADLTPGKILLGESTDSAILLAVHQLHLFGLVGIIQQLKKQYDNAKVVVTGGGASGKESHFPDDWIHIPNLVLLGAAVIGEQRLRPEAS